MKPMEDRILHASNNFKLYEYGFTKPYGVLVTTTSRNWNNRLLYILGFTEKQMKYSPKYKSYYFQVPFYMLKRVKQKIDFIEFVPTTVSNRRIR